MTAGGMSETMPNGSIAFVGEIPRSEQLRVAVYMRRSYVGELFITLEEWDQLHRDSAKMDWITVISKNALESA